MSDTSEIPHTTNTKTSDILLEQRKDEDVLGQLRRTLQWVEEILNDERAAGMLSTEEINMCLKGPITMLNDQIEDNLAWMLLSHAHQLELMHNMTSLFQKALQSYNAMKEKEGNTPEVQQEADAYRNQLRTFLATMQRWNKQVLPKMQ